MANQGQAHGTPFSVTASGTSTATASKSPVTGATYYLTDITGSSSTATLGSITVTTTPAGTSTATVLWANYLGSGAFFEDFFTPLSGAISGTISVVVTGNGSVSCFANMTGYQIGPF